MRVKKKLVALTAIFFFFPLVVFADYAEIVGREARVISPGRDLKIGVSYDMDNCAVLRMAAKFDNSRFYNNRLESFRVLRVENGTRVLVDYADITEGAAKVILLEGFYEGASGWVPLEWVKAPVKWPSFVD